MKINAKRITAVLMAAAMSVCATTAAFAASTTETPVVDENHATADFQQTITYSKVNRKSYPLTLFLSLLQQNFKKNHQHFHIHLHLKMIQPLFQAAKK